MPEAFQTNDEGTMVRMGYRPGSLRILKVEWSDAVPEYRVLSVSYEVQEQELLSPAIVSEGLIEIAVDPKGRLLLEDVNFLTGLPG
jgi:hypothetical protein